ncbi:MAG: ribosome assembly RNA-binding protein YhbY [Tissierellia bacterium]|nr:ribosome assembly RNA-binding protein YhbY [Tissierellia bacterium]
MLTGKQRSYLKSLANTLDPVVQIGKNGLTDSVIESINDVLETRELVKITVLDNSPEGVKEITSEILDRTGAEFVQSLGSKLVIYKESENNKKIELV